MKNEWIYKEIITATGHYVMEVCKCCGKPRFEVKL